MYKKSVVSFPTPELKALYYKHRLNQVRENWKAMIILLR